MTVRLNAFVVQAHCPSPSLCRSKATGGGTGSRVFPLFIPKFSDDDGSQLLHIEVSMLCSEKCTDKLLSRPLAEAGWKRMVRGFGRPLLQGNVLRQWFFLALSLYTVRALARVHGIDSIAHRRSRADAVDVGIPLTGLA